MSKEIKTDPKGRYSKKELLGSGAFKTVYRAYDTEEGIEVAWNQIKLAGVAPNQKKKIMQEISILGQLKHASIINIYDSWETDDDYLIFITELMSSGTLKDFIRNSKKVRLRNIKKWCKQVLEGLSYLHSHSIIHRDLKCDNIFMNGSRGEVKIGDLGLSVSMKDKKFATSVNGTPEFMAPEFYEECYNEKVDIYAFGLCVLEMVTGDYPYSECNSIAQVYRRVTSGVKPEGIERVKDPDVKEFINLCICHKDIRPSAAELMNHRFMTDITNNDTIFYFGIEEEDTSSSSSDEEEEQENVRVVLGNDPTNDKYSVNTKLYIKVEGNKKYKEIKFAFNLKKDTPIEVAREMVNELSLTESFVDSISKALSDCLTKAKLNFLTTKGSTESDSSSSTEPTTSVKSISSEVTKEKPTIVPTEITDTPTIVEPPKRSSTPTKKDQPIDSPTKGTPVREAEIINLSSPVVPQPISPFNGPVIKEITPIVDKKLPPLSTPKTNEQTLKPVVITPQPNNGTKTQQTNGATPVNNQQQIKPQPQNPPKPINTNISSPQNGVGAVATDQNKSATNNNTQTNISSPTSNTSPSPKTISTLSNNFDSTKTEKPLTIETKKVCEAVKKESPPGEKSNSPLLRNQSSPAINNVAVTTNGTQPNKSTRTSPTNPRTNGFVKSDDFEVQWEQLLQKQYEEMELLKAKQRKEQMELMKKFNIPLETKMTPFQFDPVSNNSVLKIVNPYQMSNLSARLINDMENKLSDVKLPSEGASIITATTIVNKLRQTSNNSFKISGTSIQTTTSSITDERAKSTPTTPSQIVVASPTAPTKPVSKPTGSQLNVNVNVVVKPNDNELSSLISKNLENLSMDKPQSIFSQVHQHQIIVNNGSSVKPDPKSLTSPAKVVQDPKGVSGSLSSYSIVPQLQSVPMRKPVQPSQQFTTPTSTTTERINRSFSDPFVDSLSANVFNPSSTLS